MAISQNTTPGTDPVEILSTAHHQVPFYVDMPDLPLAIHRFNRLQGEIHNVGEPGGVAVVCYVWIRDLANHAAVMAKLDAVHQKMGSLSGEIIVSGSIAWTSPPATFIGFRQARPHYLEGLTGKFILEGWLVWRLRGPSTLPPPPPA